MTAGTAIVLFIGLCVVAVAALLWKCWPDPNVCDTPESALRAAHEFLEATQFVAATQPKYIEARRIYDKRVPDRDLNRLAMRDAIEERYKRDHAAIAAEAAARKNGETTHG